MTGSQAVPHRVPGVPLQLLEACLQDVVRSGDHVALTVRGDCMAPGLEDGETVDIHQTRWYWPGDVVAYFSQLENRYLCHRFLGYVRAGGAWKCLVMADRAAKPDTLVEPARVLGKVVARSCSARVRLRGRRIHATTRYIYWVVRIVLRRR